MNSNMGNTCAATCNAVRQRMPWVHDQDGDMNGFPPGSPYLRIIRHYSVESEVPDDTISSLFPMEDNYVTGDIPMSRSPKSLTQLCVEQVCRSLPLLDGALPKGLPQDVVDKIAGCLLKHSALNGTTLRALRYCEVGSLNLANCRGVTDNWLRALSGYEVNIIKARKDLNAGISRSDCVSDLSSIDEKFGSVHSNKSSSTEELKGLRPRSPSTFEGQRRPYQAQTPQESQDSSSCSTSSFVSAVSKLGTPVDSEAVGWIGSLADLSPPPLPPLPTHSFTSSPLTSSLTSLDLRGSQRLTDRGLLQLHSLSLLEIARLDDCHSIVGKGLIAFSSSRRLHTLSLSNCRRLADEGIINLSHLQSLTALSLEGCRCLSDQSLHAISGLINLKKLDLSQCDLLTNAGVTYLKNLDKLEEISFGWCRLITDEGIKEFVLQHQVRKECLRVLRLSRCPITDVGVRYVSVLSKLEELDLNGCRVSSIALGNTLESLSNLRSLDVSYCPGIIKHSWQGKINTLKVLDLSYSGVRDSHLSRLTFLPALVELNLDSCLVSDWAIAHLVDNKVTPNLTSLDLADSDLTDNGMEYIAKFTKLKKLSLFYCNISNIGLRHLAHLKSLEELNLDSRDVGDQGLSYLSGLPNLRALDIFSGRITDFGCIHLSKIISLESLELCGGGIGDRGCAFLAACENLTSLNLSQNDRITNRGAAALASLSNLKTLNLSNTQVNSGALRFLSSLVRLQSLALYGCEGVDGKSISTLQNELPSLKCLRLQHYESFSIDDSMEDEFYNDDDELDQAHIALLNPSDAEHASDFGSFDDEEDAEVFEDADESEDEASSSSGSDDEGDDEQSDEDVDFRLLDDEGDDDDADYEME